MRLSFLFHHCLPPHLTSSVFSTPYSLEALVAPQENSNSKLDHNGMTAPNELNNDKAWILRVSAVLETQLFIRARDEQR